jgi:CRP-like cAMP-binding protein
VRPFEAGEVIVPVGKSVPGLHVVGAGHVELGSGDHVEEAGPGDILFAAEVLGAGVAHAEARAGRGGALVLFASRGVAHELLLEVPPLIEILAG